MINIKQKIQKLKRQKQNISITPDAQTKLELFKITEDLPFGKVILPIMIQSVYENGKWSNLKIRSYQNLTFDPTCKVFHYGQEIFEGLKAYNFNQKGPYLFRHKQNAKRFQSSALRMAIPPLNQELFIDSVEAMAYLGKEFTPTQSGDSLYIRPFIFAIDSHLGIKPSSSFLYLVIASPSGAYFNSGSIDVMIERQMTRASDGGVGNAKTGGNYAASLNSMVKAQKNGLTQVLWLDSNHKRYVEELSGMNFFAVYNNTIITPAVSSSILDGITRDSILTLAKANHLIVKEENIEINKLIKDIESGACTELFSCGTAVILTPIESLVDIDQDNHQTIYKLKNNDFKISNMLRKQLLDLQEGRSENFNDWRTKIDFN